MSYTTLNPRERVVAVGIDFTKDTRFAQLSCVAVVGDIEISDRIRYAATNGRDEVYNPGFVIAQNRKQMRYVRAHELLHKQLKHCHAYRDVCNKYPYETNVAMDIVINLMIEEIDPHFTFVERPTVGLFIDPKYTNWGFLRILQDLIKKGNGGQGQGQGQPVNGVHGGFDAHEFDELSDEELDALKPVIEEAARQGQLLAEKLAAGNKGGGKRLNIQATQSRTDWRQHMREFFTTICAGDENSRFAPPNKRLAPQGYLLPSHFSYNKGDIIIACDTSSSMARHYGMLFGEIARIAQDVMPDSVRILWWDTSVCGDQKFEPRQYANIAALMKPAGGGGTTPDCVVRHIVEKQYKPRAVIWLTDGELYGPAPVVNVPVLWGVVNNEHFVAPEGKTIHIYGAI
jgi:predicted metal-dependent peptidase